MNLRLLITLSALTTAVSAADWPQFRGPHCSGSSSETTLPRQLDLNRDLAWKTDLPGRGLSSPIVVGDRVFITCSSGPKQQRLHVVCFSAADGRKLWHRQFWATGRTMCQPKTCVAAPSPASDGTHVVAIFSSNDIVCLDRDGNLLWFRGLGRDYPNASNSVGMSSSLLIAGGVVITQVESESEGFTAGLELDSGVNRWKLSRPRKANWTSPISFTSAGRELVGLQSPKGLAAVDPSTGSVIWDYPDATSSIPSSTPGPGLILLPAHGLTAVQTGPDGASARQVWRSSQLHPGTSSPVIVGDKILVLNDAGVLSCGWATNGTRQWQLRLKGPFSASPVGAGSVVYCVSEKGLVQVVDTSMAEGQVVSELDLGDTILSTPAISGGAIYFRSDSRLWKIGKS